MVFSTNYILNNPDIITTFINGITQQRNINKVYINDFNIIPIVLLVIQNISNLNELYLLPKQPIDYDIFEKILYSPNIKFVSCYSMKHFMIEKLDKKDITVVINETMNFESKFMADNSLKNYSSIYYKKSLNINQSINKEDLADIEIFCRINKYLKVINFYYYSQETIRLVLKNLIKYKIKNVKIYIYENKENVNYLHSSVQFLRLLKKELSNSFKFTFKIIYSEEYKKENFVAQLNLNNIKLMTITVAIFIIIGFAIMEYNSFASEKSIDDINSVINTEIIKVTDNISSDNPSTDPMSSEVEDINHNDIYKKAFGDIFNILKSKNSDTVGWLKVNNTLIEYPIVQTNNNEYYLKNDFNKNRNIFGWVFMDWRNNHEELNQNTILYGHNSRKKVAFGTLKYALNKDWYTNEDNQIITFNTPYYNMEWQIFSIYVIDVTSDYLYVSFDNQNDFINFASKVTARSIYDFGIDVKENDKMLTLSTCINNSKQRIVVHAKLINKY